MKTSGTCRKQQCANLPAASNEGKRSGGKGTDMLYYRFAELTTQSYARTF